jgi:3D (Asp-Asp-Asp) domain-containing protein
LAIVFRDQWNLRRKNMKMKYLGILMLVWAVAAYLTGVYVGMEDIKETLAPEIELRDERLREAHDNQMVLYGKNEDLQQELQDSQKRVAKLRGTVSLLGKDLTSEWHFTDAVITAYSPLDDQNGINSEGDPTRTSIGMKVGQGRFAVDPDRIPYGSRMLIIYSDGSTEEGIAADTGGALRNAEHTAIDVFRKTYDQALTFGSNEATVIWQAPKKEK